MRRLKSKEPLYQYTLTLIQYNQDAISKNKVVRETKEKADFYKEVHPFVTEVREVCRKWEPLAIAWVEKHQPKYLHPIQLKNTAENIQLIAVQSFFPETSLKRFENYVRSVDYVLQRLLEELHKEK